VTVSAWIRLTCSEGRSRSTPIRHTALPPSDLERSTKQTALLLNTATPPAESAVSAPLGRSPRSATPRTHSPGGTGESASVPTDTVLAKRLGYTVKQIEKHLHRLRLRLSAACHDLARSPQATRDDYGDLRVTENNGFSSAVNALVSGPEAERRIKQYLEPGRFTGAMFDVIADTAKPKMFTTRDFAAVMMLSTEIPWQTRHWLARDDGTNEASALLRKIPANARITDGTNHLAQGGPAWELWHLLRTAAGMGPTRVSKLMAAKRPHLVPIHDSYVERALGVSAKTSWRRWREFMRNNKPCLDTLDTIAKECGGSELSELRLIDIVVWMSEHDKQKRAKVSSVKSPTPNPALVPTKHRTRDTAN
jgi:hypothetical protein